MTTGTPTPQPQPPDSKPPRRNDRLRGIVAGAIAVLAVLAGIFLVNLLNDPSDSGSSTAASGPRAAGPTPTSEPAATATASEPAETPSEPARTTASTAPTSAAPTSAAPTSPAPTSAAPPPAPERVFATVTIFNDSRIPGLAQEAIAPVEAAGFTVDRVGNFTSVYDTPVTTVFYDPEHEAAARTMLDTVAGVERMAPRSETNIVKTGTLILVVTRDFPVNSE